MIFQPEIGFPLAVSDLTGVPVTPSPQAIAGPVVASELSSAESNVTLYRGVNSSSPAYKNATQGVAIPKGGNATPAEHNAGNTFSPYTSWSKNPAVAENFALRPSGQGVVLKTTVPASSTVPSPSVKSVNLIQMPGKVVNEMEVLIKGPFYNASPIQVSSNH